MQSQNIVVLLLLSFYFTSFLTLGSPNGVKTQVQPKEQAFSVLQTKCNFCHAVKKRTEVFTLSNMDSLALEINNQVFIKRKLPKGKKVTLTLEEEKILKSWIELTLESPLRQEKRVQKL